MSREKLVITIFGISTFGVAFCGLIEATTHLVKVFNEPGMEKTLTLDFSYGGLAGILIVCSVYYLCKMLLLGKDWNKND